jgi:hypothetical protein
MNLNNLLSKNFSYLISSSILSIFVLICLHFNLLNSYIIVGGNEGALFADFKHVLESSICYPEIDVYSYNPCTNLGGNRYSYGSSSLKIMPYAEDYFDIYMFIVPSAMIFFSTLIILNLFKPKKITEYFLVVLIIFSTPIMLGLERGQLDLLVFIILYIVAVSRNIYFETVCLLFLSSLKFYPAICFGVYFNKKINTQFILTVLVFLISILLIFYLDRENITKVLNLVKIYDNNGSIERIGMYVFSYELLPTLSSLTLLHLNNVEFNKEYFAHYSYFLTVFILTILYIYFLIKFFSTKKYKLIIFNIENFEDKLFILSSLITITLFFLFQGMIYKEIYILGLIPFLLKNIKNNYLFTKLIYYLIIIKFIGLTLLWLIQTTLLPTSLFFKGFNILNKGIIDSLLIFYIGFYLIVFFKQFVNKNFKFLI